MQRLKCAVVESEGHHRVKKSISVGVLLQQHSLALFLFFNPDIFDSSYHLPNIPHIPPQNSTEYHLYILNKRVMPIILAVKSDLIRINNSIIILPRNHPPYP